ncbi:MAG: hypothetical protein HY809_06495 [Nitrospirae bacterium]|nr:hypothetical protein [Nitrospirota bacterium]
MPERIYGLGASGEKAAAVLNKSVVSIGAESGNPKQFSDLGQVIKNFSIDERGSRLFLIPDNEKEIHIFDVGNGALAGRINTDEKTVAFCVDSVRNLLYAAQQEKGVIDVFNLSTLTKTKQFSLKEKISNLFCYSEKNLLLAVIQNDKNTNGSLQLLDGEGVLKERYVFDKKIKNISLDDKTGKAAILTWEGKIYMLDINSRALSNLSYLNQNTADIELRGSKLLATDAVSGNLLIADSSSGGISEKVYIGANAEHIACTGKYCFVTFKQGIKVLKEESPASTIELNIVFPPDNETISKPYTLVTGTVSNSAGKETGVTVNGIIADTYNGGFLINNLHLLEGENTIVVTAADTAGSVSSASRKVYYSPSAPYITLGSNNMSGIAPLKTYFYVDTAIPNSVSSFKMDYEGDGVIDYTGTSFDDISFEYASEGVYYPTAFVIDSENNVYQSYVAIVVQNAAELNTLLNGKWEGMRSSLLNQDVERALGYFAERAKDKYRRIFTALENKLPEITGNFVEFNILDVYENSAEYEVIANENGIFYSYPGTLIKDGSGIWKFKDF